MGINVDINVINHKNDKSSVLLEMATSAQGATLLRNTWKNGGTERKCLQSWGQNWHYFILDKFFSHVNDIRECLLHITFHAAFPSFIWRGKKKKKKAKKMTFMWPCSDKLKCIKLMEEKTNKQTNQCWAYTKMWFIFQRFYGKTNKFPFQSFGVSVGKKRQAGVFWVT